MPHPRIPLPTRGTRPVSALPLLLLLALLCSLIGWAQAPSAGAAAATDGDGRADHSTRFDRWGEAGLWGRSSPVVVADQTSRRVLLLDPKVRTWDPVNDPEAVLWSFSPDNDPRYADVRPLETFLHVDEAKVKRWRGKDYLLTNASGGFVGVVEYPSGDRYWAADVGRPSNAHSTELLPDGNVAVSASTGGFIRVYAASQGPAATTYAEYKLKGGHGVRWDPFRRVLWALGDDYLVQLKVGGTKAEPTLTEVSKTALPSYGGHDLAPVALNPDRFWVTTNTQVYQYSKSRGEFLQDYKGVEVINRPKVKSIGDDPRTGQVISVAPEPGHPCTWCTSTVQVYNPNGEYTLVDGGMYKARWWVPWIWW